MDASASPDFAQLAPLGADYATRPIDEAIDWAAAASDPETAGEWYLVVFRSLRKETVDQDRLDALDDAAHLEAEHAPGFVHYFKGPLGADRSCLSFCLWTGRHEAREAAGKPAHREAISIIADAYERYTLEFYRVAKVRGETSFTIEPYDRVLAAA